MDSKNQFGRKTEEKKHNSHKTKITTQHNKNSTFSKTNNSNKKQ